MKSSELGSKNFKNLPHTEETKEELEFINKNDPGFGQKTGRAFKFVPAEEIPDPDTLGESENDNEVELEGTEQNEIPSEEEKTAGELNDFLKMSEDVGFHQGAGVAHIGPEFINSDEKKEENKNNESSKVPEYEYENEQPMRLSKTGYNVSNLSLAEREIYSDRNTGSQHDNLKTFKKNVSKSGAMKTERIGRGETREILHAEVEEEPHWQDPRDLLDLSEN